MSRKLFSLLSLVLIATFVLSACGGAPAPATEAPKAAEADQSARANQGPGSRQSHGYLVAHFDRRRAQGALAKAGR